MLQENTRRRLAGSAAAIFLIRLLPAGAAAVSGILLSRRLPQAVYGTYQGYWTDYSLLSAIAALGLPTFLLTLPPERAAEAVLGSRRMKMIVLATLMSTSLLLVFQQRAQPPLIIFFGVTIMMALVVNAIVEPLLLQQGKSRLLMISNLLFAGGYLSCHWLLALGRIGFTQLFGSIAVLSVLKLIVCGTALPSLAADVPVAVPGKAFNVAWRHFALSDIIGFVFRWIDKVILKAIIPASAFAVYFNGTQEVPFFPILMSAVGSSILLHLTRSQTGAHLEGLALVRRSAELLAWIVFPIFYFLAFFRTEIFVVIFSAKYAGAAPLFLATVCLIPIRVYSWSALFQHAGRMDIVNRGAVLDLFAALAMMYPAYQIAGLTGVAAVFTISGYLQGAYYTFHLRRLFNVAAWKLFPLRMWALQLLLFGALYVTIYYFASQYFSASVVLIIGVLFTGVVTAVPIMRTFLQRRRNV